MAVIKEIETNKEEFIQWRHALHQHPGLGFEEEFAAKLIEDKLNEFGFDEVHTQIGKTGVVGILKGKHASDKVIGLRADMDALPIQEENQFAHRSCIDGKMHACGHDGHTATLLACAWYLSKTRDFAGTVVFIFQPAEEGLGGGLAMIEDGLFQRFQCERIYAYHNMPKGNKGEVYLREGAFLAGASFFDIHIQGVGGHAAMPHTTVDPALIMSNIIQSAQSIISRNVPASETAILSFTDSYAGSNSYNIIPHSATMKGCLRFFDKEIGQLVQKRFAEVVENAAKLYGGSATIQFEETFVPLINDPKACEIAAQAAVKVVGESAVHSNAPVVTASEDFAFMLEHVPGCYVTIGAGEAPSPHHPQYDFEDDLLPIAASYFCQLVDIELNN
ncbi:MAG: M20 aminoacylase family protein [Vibrio sp.]